MRQVHWRSLAVETHVISPFSVLADARGQPQKSFATTAFASSSVACLTSCGTVCDKTTSLLRWQPQRFLQADKVRQQKDHRDKCQEDLRHRDALGRDRLRRDVAVAKEREVESAEVDELKHCLCKRRIREIGTEACRADPMQTVKVESKRKNDLSHIDQHQHHEAMVSKIAASGLHQLTNVLDPEERGLQKARDEHQRHRNLF